MRKHRRMLSQGHTSAQTTVRTPPLSGSTMAESSPKSANVKRRHYTNPGNSCKLGRV